MPCGRAFAAVQAIEAINVVGDQLAKVAISLLVYDRTGSAVWSGLAYALTLLPPLVAGPVLVPLADRLAPRPLMVGCCLLQAVTVAAMAVPSLPCPAFLVLVVGVTALGSPYRAAQALLVLELLGSRGNKTGATRLMMITEMGQLAGLAAAAGVVSALGVPAALALDVVTFAAAAVLLMVFLPSSAGPMVPSAVSPPARRPVVNGRPGVAALVVLALTVGVTAVPDGVVAPLVAQEGLPRWAVGPLLGADCAGILIGATLVQRLAPRWQARAIGPLALFSVLVLTGFALRPGLLGTGGLLALSGAGAAYLALARAEFLERVPRRRAGTAIGLLRSGMRATQGVAVLGGGLLAEAVGSAAVAIATAGGVGVILAAGAALAWSRALAQDCDR